MSVVDEMWRCKDHGKHCKGIQYLEKGQEKVYERLEKIDYKVDRGFVDKTTEIKDCRKSLTSDLNATDLLIQKTYVTKAEFDAKMKINYLVVGAIVLKFVRDYLS